MARSENLTIMFTDLVGFTARTSKQSREENAAMLRQHDQLFVPVVAAYGGRKIKSIGDAMLVTFKSPTDAVRCGMGLQDAAWEYNREREKDDQLHIRVALTLGEVRLEGGDVFGEPVNIASRIEGITPADEIYLSESVYLAMNKAEVPTESVGSRELKGIPEPVGIYRVPPHQTARLVVETPFAADATEGFPFGGLHRAGTDAGSAVRRTVQQAVLAGGQATETLLQTARVATPWMERQLARGRDVLTTTLRPALVRIPRSVWLVGVALLVAVLLLPPLWRAVMPSALADAERDMAAGRWDEVQSSAEALLAKDKDDAEALVLLGHVACARKQRKECFQHYAEALTLDAGLRDDPRFVANAVDGLAWVGKPAVDLLEKYPSSASNRALRERAGEPGYWGRQRAVEVLEADGEGDSIDRVELALRDLADAPSCDKRREAVLALRELDDERALPALREAASDTSFFSRNRCLAKDAEEAAAAIAGD